MALARCGSGTRDRPHTNEDLTFVSICVCMDEPSGTQRISGAGAGCRGALGSWIHRIAHGLDRDAVRVRGECTSPRPRKCPTIARSDPGSPRPSRAVALACCKARLDFLDIEEIMERSRGCNRLRGRCVSREPLTPHRDTHVASCQAQCNGSLRVEGREAVGTRRRAR